MASEEGDRTEQNVPHTSVIEIVSKSGRPVTGFFSSNILPAHRTMTDYGAEHQPGKREGSGWRRTVVVARFQGRALLSQGRTGVSRRHGVLPGRPERRTMQSRQDCDILKSGTILFTPRRVSVAIGGVVGQRLHFANQLPPRQSKRVSVCVVRALLCYVSAAHPRVAVRRLSTEREGGE